MNRRDFLLSVMGAATMAVLPVPDEKPFPYGWLITEEVIEPGLYGDISDRYAKALARSMMQTREIMAKNVLERAFGDENETEDDDEIGITGFGESA